MREIQHKVMEGYLITHAGELFKRKVAFTSSVKTGRTIGTISVDPSPSGEADTQAVVERTKDITVLYGLNPDKLPFNNN